MKLFLKLIMAMIIGSSAFHLIHSENRLEPVVSEASTHTLINSLRQRIITLMHIHINKLGCIDCKALYCEAMGIVNRAYTVENKEELSWKLAEFKENAACVHCSCQEVGKPSQLIQLIELYYNALVQQ